jgi:tRNA threonylcarbamoyladenosine biosynthesis protein TsaE
MPSPKRSHTRDHDLSSHGPLTCPSEDTWVIRLQSPKETQNLGYVIGHQLHGGEIIALRGELGTGKTVLTKGIALGLGIPPEQVTSPTFTFVHEYYGRLRLIHTDLYRIQNLAELQSIGLEDYYDSSTSVVIEWADRMGFDDTFDYLIVQLTHLQRYTRLATIKAHGPGSHSLLQKLKANA